MERELSKNSVLLTWCEPDNSVQSYRIYKDGEEFMTVDATITYVLLDSSFCGPTPPATNHSVTSIVQFTPLIESPKMYCPISIPTKAPNISPSI